MSTVTQGVCAAPAGRTMDAPGGAPASPLAALATAFSDTVRLLFNPLDARRWIKLSMLCLFLGGGTFSAAFHWSLGALPDDIGFQQAAQSLREYAVRHPWLIVLAIAVGLGLGVTLVYLRALSRFLLVDSILRREVVVRRVLPELLPQAHSYFFWVLGALVAVGAALGASVLIAFPYLHASVPSLALSIVLAGLLLAEAFLSLVVGLLIALTDDLAVPLIYAERLPFLAAWRRLGRMMLGEAGAFALYIVLRFAVSVCIGLTVLLFLFPALVALFSTAIIAGVAAILALRLVGVAWVWTPLTIVLAALALSILMSLVLALMGVTGMPGQVFLQSFGMRFIAHRVPALNGLWQIGARRT